MAELVLIYGKSGSGKSRSLKNFAENEIFLINVEGKRLPFKKKFAYQMTTDNYNTIVQKLSNMAQKTAIKTVVIDDAGYLLTNNFMRGHSSGRKGSQVFDLYNDLADNFWGLFKFIKNCLPSDIIVYLIMHEDTNDNGITKLKTIGKMLDDKACLEGMVTICLRCASSDGKHFFKTVTDGYDITKSPEDMFESDEIDNDLKFVDEKIREYYDLTERNDQK